MPNPHELIPDYLLIGHIAHDVTPQGPQLGGTVSYAAHTAAAFGLRVAILTSTAPDEPLLAALPPQALVISIPAEHTTTFENIYDGDSRTQYLHHRAAGLGPVALPPAWRKARLVHLGPIAYEIDPALMSAFDGSRICVTPQGWMRKRESDGRVSTIPWASAGQVLPKTALTVLSEEDIRHDPGLEHAFAALAPLMILTRGKRGGTIYRHSARREFPAFPAHEVNPTGAGDIFATVLHIMLEQTGDLDYAVMIAARLAGQSVTRVGLASVPTPQEIAQAVRS
ncbi:MAG: ribokinase [Anaerolineae bacterium]|nr:ribokinase [Anaerolineae bacterium]